MSFYDRALSMLFALCVLLAAAGCANVRAVMDSWVGHHQSELILSWGPPQAVYSDGKDGTILVYSQERTWTTPGRADTRGGPTVVYGNRNIARSWRATTTYTPPRTHSYTVSRMFYVDPEGRIYAWRCKGR